MTKKPSQPPERDKKNFEKGRRKQLIVIDTQGVRKPFLRGMITHDLVQRGLEFDDAYAAARAIRDRLVPREEVATAEIRDLIQQQLEEMFGAEQIPIVAPTRAERSSLQVIYHGQGQPFSRGLLARSLYATGVDLDRAYRLVADLEGQLRRDGVTVLPSDEVARRAGELLERHEGVEVARRYWLLRRIHHLPRPIVIYVGGASGTGKSTLALELAPLLRIYRITATDTIRQMMRMVFSPEMLPALHSSSFELPSIYARYPGEETLADKEGEAADSDFEHRVIATFEEQAIRVGVGVRAVVERAIAENMSILIEGVHLYPPLIPFSDLEGAAYQVPLLLATTDGEAHRSRFLARARLGGRRAERYLENFASIRSLHDFLLHQADAFDTPWLDTSETDGLVVKTLRLVTSRLQKKLPGYASAARKEPEPIIPTLLLIIDGLADRAVRALGGRTPLQAAATPNFDRLAREGRCGLADPVAPGVVPDTAAGSLALFGQSPIAMKRGPIEALGAGLELSPGDVALRGNFATLSEQGHVIDRRAGRIRDDAEALAQALDRLPLPGSLSQEVEVRVKPATEHRLAIALRGDRLSSAIQGSDPGEGAHPEPPLTPRPRDPKDENAVYTARALALFEQEARRVLAGHPINEARSAAGLPPANAILTRGAGRVHRLIPLESGGVPLELSCIGGDRTVLGLAGWLGAEVISQPGMTANLDTDLRAKLVAADEALKRSDLVILHVKGADIAAHDQRPDLKVAFLERLDQEVGRFLEERTGAWRLAVGADHATLSESGQHAADPVPILIWGEGIESDDVQRFDERSVGAGGLQRFPLQMLLARLFDLG